MDVVRWDVIVVGGGLAGFTSALRAAQTNLKVLLIEKSEKPLGDGNTLMASGSLRAGGKNPRGDPAELYAFVMSEGIGRPDLVKAWAETCGRAIDWLIQAGVGLNETGPGRLWLDQESEISLAPVYKRDVGSRALAQLKARFLSCGGYYWAGVEGIRLLLEGNHVSGITVRRSGEELNLDAGATLLCTGGFSANPELLRRFVGAHADECKLRGSSQSTGDGLRMALEIGAKAVNLQYFYGHLIARNALTDDRFWPYPRLDPFVEEGILVDRNGLRFVDEGRGDVAVANELARSDEVTGATLIFDHTTWSASQENPASTSRAIPSANPWLWENDADLFCTATVAALADALGINEAQLVRTVDDYNDAVAAHETLSLPITRTGNPKVLRPPYYGLRVVPGITFTMGGIAVNGRCEVLNVYDVPLQGLYAAGDAIGGLMGGYKGGYTGGLMQAVVTGILASENAARFARSA